MKQVSAKLDTTTLRTERKAAANRGLAKVAIQCSTDTFVLGGSSVLRMKLVLIIPAIAPPKKR